ncbi:hypothetical protein BT69DRAFT_1353370 [Atractiella rhizophila]|nr:hypothetical protein BT69DRAFT_1353370 [Atractiella rhizophila]
MADDALLDEIHRLCVDEDDTSMVLAPKNSNVTPPRPQPHIFASQLAEELIFEEPTDAIFYNVGVSTNDKLLMQYFSPNRPKRAPKQKDDMEVNALANAFDRTQVISNDQRKRREMTRYNGNRRDARRNQRSVRGIHSEVINQKRKRYFAFNPDKNAQKAKAGQSVHTNSDEYWKKVQEERAKALKELEDILDLERDNNARLTQFDPSDMAMVPDCCAEHCLWVHEINNTFYDISIPGKYIPLRSEVVDRRQKESSEERTIRCNRRQKTLAPAF